MKENASPLRIFIVIPIIVIMTMVLFIFAFGADASTAEPAYVIISHGELRPLSRGELVDIFLLRSRGGLPHRPVDLAMRSPVREAFSRDIHGRSPRAVSNTWAHRTFNGGQAGPPIMPEADALAFVASTKGAIAYVSLGLGVNSDVNIVTVKR